MLEKKESLLRSEIARSRKDPFAHSDESLGPVESLTESGENPLKDLKAEVLSIDWEITDKVMTRFINEVERLRETYKNDKVLLLFLRLLDSIGKYVKLNKGKSHPDAIKLLNSVYNSLEKVVQLKGATEEERQKILSIEVERFKRLKAQIAQRKAARPTRKEPRPTVQPEPAGEEKDLAAERETRPDASSRIRSLPHAPASPDLVAALEEIKEIIRGEFKALRAELRLLIEGAQSGP